MTKTGRTLLAMYEAMRSRFGPQGWWPASPHLAGPQRRLEICVGAILTQNTNWRNVERALANLNAAGHMSVESLRRLGAAQLAELIRPAGYFNVKAKRLRHFLDHVHERFGGDLDALLALDGMALRHELLAVNGIGPETADSMVLYAAGKLSFVVDAYTRRVLVRHRLIEGDWSYDRIKTLFESSLPADVGLYNDYHAQLVAVGKWHCRPTARCDGCPLVRFAHVC